MSIPREGVRPCDTARQHKIRTVRLIVEHLHAAVQSPKTLEGAVFSKESTVKGPGLRVELDVRRLWECPQCGRRQKTGGDVVTVRCGCTPQGIQMRLIETGRRIRSFDEIIKKVLSESENDPQQRRPNRRKANRKQAKQHKGEQKQQTENRPVNKGEDDD